MAGQHEDQMTAAMPGCQPEQATPAQSPSSFAPGLSHDAGTGQAAPLRGPPHPLSPTSAYSNLLSHGITGGSPTLPTITTAVQTPTTIDLHPAQIALQAAAQGHHHTFIKPAQQQQRHFFPACSDEGGVMALERHESGDGSAIQMPAHNPQPAPSVDSNAESSHSGASRHSRSHQHTPAEYEIQSAPSLDYPAKAHSKQASPDTDPVPVLSQAAEPAAPPAPNCPATVQPPAQFAVLLPSAPAPLPSDFPPAPMYSPGTQQQRDALLRLLHQQASTLGQSLGQVSTEQATTPMPYPRLVPESGAVAPGPVVLPPQLAAYMQQLIMLQAATGSAQPAQAPAAAPTAPTASAPLPVPPPAQEPTARHQAPVAAAPAGPDSDSGPTQPQRAAASGTPTQQMDTAQHPAMDNDMAAPAPAPEAACSGPTFIAASFPPGVMWGVPVVPPALAALPPTTLDNLGVLPFGAALMPASPQPPAVTGSTPPPRPTEVIGESTAVGTGHLQQQPPLPPQLATWNTPYGASLTPPQLPLPTWPQLRLRPVPTTAPEPAMSNPSMPGNLAVASLAKPQGPQALAAVPRRATYHGYPTTDRPQLFQPQTVPPPDSRLSEPSEQEEDAAATLAGLIADMPGRAAHSAPSQARAVVQQRRSAASGGAGAATASGSGVRRRSPPGGSAVWAQHPEVMMPGVHAGATGSTTSTKQPGDSHGHEDPVTPVGPAPVSAFTPTAVHVPRHPLPRINTRPAGSHGHSNLSSPVTTPVAGGLTSLPASERQWLEELTTTDRFFKLCENCGGGLKAGERPSNGGRDALCTLLDLDEPLSPGVCANCRSAREAQGHRLLQIRRSTYNDVVKTQDMAMLRVDLTGVQAYSINNSRVVFLKPRPSSKPPKGSTMPSRCVLDGRGLMDTGTRYCCLRCKIEVELHGVPPVMSSTPEPVTPTTSHARTSGAHHRTPTSRLATTSTAIGSPVSSAPRKRQHTPVSSPTASQVSPTFSAYRPTEDMAERSHPLPAATALLPTQEEQPHKRPRIAGAGQEHTLYVGDHGVLTAMADMASDAADKDIQREVQAEAAHMMANKQALVDGSEAQPTPPPQLGNPPFSRGRVITQQQTAPSGEAAAGGHDRRAGGGAVLHHVTFDARVARPLVSTESTGSERTLSAVGSGHTPGGTLDMSDSRSTGSTKRKSKHVHRAPAE